MQRKRETFTATAVVLAAGAAVACADISDPVVTFSASSSLGSGTFTVYQDDGAWNGDEWFWSAPGPVEILSDGGEVIMTLTQGSAFFAEDPVIALGFSAMAGDSDTVFTIDSGTLSFDLIEGAQGRASAGMTVTESNGDTATVTGTRAGGSMYSALFNGDNSFTELLAGPFVENDAWGTEDATDEFPGGGAFTTVGDVVDISVKWGMEVSANDQVSGTSVFVVVPAPGAAALLALAAGVVSRRRR